MNAYELPRFVTYRMSMDKRGSELRKWSYLMKELIIKIEPKDTTDSRLKSPQINID